MSRWVGGWVTGVGECGVEELLVAASFIVRSLFWLNAFQMEFAFWDCGGLQALVAVQSGEFQIVHGIGAAEGFRGGPWEFRDGLLHGSAATVDPKHQFDWDVALGDDMVLSLEHRHYEVSIPCSVAQNMFEGKVLNLSLPHGAGSSSSGTALRIFRDRGALVHRADGLRGRGADQSVGAINPCRGVPLSCVLGLEAQVW